MKLENIKEFKTFKKDNLYCIGSINSFTEGFIEISKYNLNKLFGITNIDFKIIELYCEGICIDYCLKFKQEKTAIEFCNYINELLSNEKIKEEVKEWTI